MLGEQVILEMRRKRERKSRDMFFNAIFVFMVYASKSFSNIAVHQRL